MLTDHAEIGSRLRLGTGFMVFTMPFNLIWCVATAARRLLSIGSFSYICNCFIVITCASQLHSLGFFLSEAFWTRRGYRYLPFSPPVRSFLFIAYQVQHSR